MSSSVFTLLFFLILTCLFSVPAFADTIDLSVTYGYQNIAKAGRYLPLSITIENTDFENLFRPHSRLHGGIKKQCL